MPVSRPCVQCGAVARCRMYLDSEGAAIYLCARCARRLARGVDERIEARGAVRVPPRDDALHTEGVVMSTSGISWEDARALAYAIARGQRFAHEDAEDIAQDVCLSLLSTPRFGRGLIAVRTYSLAARRAIRNDTRTRAEAAWAPPADYVDLDPEAQQDISRELGALRPAQRDVVVAYVLAGRTEREIAAQRGTSQPAVHTLLVRGLRALARKLAIYREMFHPTHMTAPRAGQFDNPLSDGGAHGAVRVPCGIPTRRASRERLHGTLYRHLSGRPCRPRRQHFGPVSRATSRAAT